MSAPGAYGAGMAGGAFDPVSFIKRPQVITRVVCWILSIIVFACISTGAWYVPGDEYSDAVCQLNADDNACRFSVAVGVIAFLACIVFLIVDALFDHFSNIKHRKYAVLSDLIFSGVWTLMWFVTFCYLCDAWRKTKVTHETPFGKDYPDASDINAAIAFSFFSIPPWGILTFLALRRYREGVSAEFSPSQGFEDIGGGPAEGYYPDLGAQSYQTPAFGQQQGNSNAYQAPGY
jgi:hypothetical protein